MNQIQELATKLEAIGHQFLGVVRTDSGVYIVYALDPKEASRLYGPKPIKARCRDLLDYRESMRHWKMKGTYVLFADTSSERALANALFKVQK